jgi:hypothetical protein
VPQQALYLLNSAFVARQARELMNRPELASIESEAERIRALYRLVYQREPDPEELELGTRFVLAQSGHPPIENPGPAWRYGFGGYAATEGRVAGFSEMEHYAADRWQPGEEYPASQYGHLALKAGGGHPGGDASQSAIRRWVAPVPGTVVIEGKLEHPGDKGDGVRALIVHGRHGELARWDTFNTSVDTMVDKVAVHAGDTIDFVIEPRETADHDSFNWAPRIRLLDGDQFELLQTVWSAASDFGGPEVQTHKPLGAWERYAQVLLQSNEVAFLD